MSNTEMPKAYEPKHVEERLYEWWEKRGYFTPQMDRDAKRKPFVISIPPPNVTGELHHGHAMFVTFEDLMIRWHRMLGDATLWVPGSDHAGIATQNVVERALEKQGIQRRDIGRDAFIARTWEWKEEYGGIINMQIRRLGASCDWTRERFTLDDGLSRAVREAFVRLYEKKLIYRGPRLVNWCPKDESAISDLEVEHETEKIKLYFVKYPLEGSPNEFITVATTRPETMLGDTGIAVHPRDKRYKKLIGRTARLPLLQRPLPIIADEKVKPAFGTGAVKVTPAHDPTDFEMGARHHLPQINILNSDATINANGGAFQGMDRYEARKKIVAQLERDGLLDHVENYETSIGRCQRCNAIIEPLISTQWFVKTKPLAVPAIRAVKTGKIKIIPARFNKTYFQWMDNIRDWCISRQLWWGHRIPVWYCDNGHQTCARMDPTECAACGSQNIRQEEDVLDTWFSSALWPFSTLGWPAKTDALKFFYPTTVLETGYDILFFWVARMIMMGLECTGKIPFKSVYLHGMMRHKDGSRLAKQNPQPGDNPLDVIRDFSADALRYTIVTSSTPGTDTKLDLEKVEQARNFGNKIWNMARFILGNLGSAPPQLPITNYQLLSLPARWILSRLNRLTASVTKAYTNWQFGEGTRQIYEFLWDEFADWYIEASKIVLNGDDAAAKSRTLGVLLHTLEQALRLLHPAMPFVTEEVWQHLRGALASGEATGDFAGPNARSDWADALIIAPWPRANKKMFDARAEKEFAAVMESVRAIRNARREFNVEAGKKIPAMISAGTARPLFDSQRAVIALLAHLDPAQLQIEKAAACPARALALVAGKTEIFLPFEGMLDVVKEKARLKNETEKTRADVARQTQLLASEFSKRAPRDVVAKTREQLAANIERLGKLDAQMASLEGRAVTKAKRLPTKGTKNTKKKVNKKAGARKAKKRGARK